MQLTAPRRHSELQPSPLHKLGSGETALGLYINSPDMVELCGVLGFETLGGASQTMHSVQCANQRRSETPMSPTTEQVWEALDHAFFGVLAFVNRDGHPRTAGVCYAVDGRSLFISTDKPSWKVRHIAANPNVSMTVTLPKRVPFLPFIKVPAATITFQGEAQLLEVSDVDESVFKRLPRGKDIYRDLIEDTTIIRVIPRGEFATYGIAMPITQMRKHEEAHGRAACGTEREVLSTTSTAAARNPPTKPT